MHEAPRSNLGSVRVPAAPTARVPPRLAWKWPSPRRRHAGWRVEGDFAAVGCCDEQPTADHFELTRFLTAVVELDSGQERYRVAGCLPVAVAGGQLLTVSEDRRALAALRLKDGVPAWTHSLGAQEILVGERHLYLWQGSSLQSCPWSPEEGPTASPAPVPLPAGEIGYVREGGGTLAVYTWRAEPRVHGELTLLRSGRPIWARVFPDYCSHDLLPLERGWILRTPMATEAYTSEGAPLWTGVGLDRCWLSPTVLVGLRGERLWVLDCATGRARDLGEHAVWDLAVAGEHLWLADRRHRRLTVLATDGEPLWSGAADVLPLYGPDRLLAADGAVYGLGDDGSLVAWR